MELFKTIPEIETKTSGIVSDCSRKSSAGNPWAGQSPSILGRLFYHRTAKCKETTKRANPENPVDKNGRMKRKKRFGRSIKIVAPATCRQKQSSFLNQQVGCMLRYRFYIVPVSTITHQILTFQRNCHSECIIWQMEQKFKETGIPLTYCIVSIKLIHRSTN